MSSNKKMYFDNDEVEKKILIFQKTGDRRQLEELIPIFEKLISGVIGKYKLLRRNYINDDLYQEAWVGIMEVINKWNKEKGDAFSYLTAVAKNKIFWYLKNNYKDTSMNAPEIVKISINSKTDDIESSIDLEDTSRDKLDVLLICDYIKKLTIDQLDVDKNDEDYAKILESFKKKIISEDNIEYSDLVKETQKELGIQKKKIRTLLDAIYVHFKDE